MPLQCVLSTVARLEVSWQSAFRVCTPPPQLALQSDQSSEMNAKLRHWLLLHVWLLAGLGPAPMHMRSGWRIAKMRALTRTHAT